MKANVNKKYAHDAMDVMEQVAVGQMMLTLHDHFGWGAQRLNKLKDLVREDMNERNLRTTNPDRGHRGLKYSKADLMVPLLNRDLKDIGIDNTRFNREFFRGCLENGLIPKAAEINGRLEKMGVIDDE